MQVGASAAAAPRPYLRTRPALPPSALLASARLLGSPRRDALPPPLDGDRVTFHVKARNALWHVVRALGIQPPENVLVPSYNCGAELDAVLRAPAAVRFYRVDRSARVDLDDLTRAVDSRTRAVLVTHYFGFPQPELPAIVQLCRDRSLFLIEDCAHALYSTQLGRPLGTFGAASIFSLWKTLPTIDGGVAVANVPLPLDEPAEAPPLDDTLRALRVGVEAHLVFRFGRAGSAVTRLTRPLAPVARGAARWISRRDGGADDLEPSLNPHVTFDRSTAHRSMSGASRRIARRSPHDEIARRRRRNYAFLAGALAPLPGVRPLHQTLPEGVCPVVLPIVVDEPGSLLRRLGQKAIGAELFWSDFHPAFPAADFPESAYLKTHVVALPIHQDLDPRLLARVADVVRAWSRRR